MNPGVDDYTKTLKINGKYSEKRKTTTLYHIKRILKPKYKLCGGLVFTFSWPGDSNRPSHLPLVTPLQQTL